MTSESWDEMFLSLEKLIFSSSTKVRIPTLTKIAALLTEQPSPIQDSEVPKIAVLLLKTYYLYLDLKSRAAVVAVFMLLLQRQPLLLPKLIKFVSDIAQSGRNFAITDVLTLLEWINRFAVHAAETAQFAALAQDIILGQAYLLAACVDHAATAHQDKKRKKESAVATTKAAVQQILAAPDALATYIQTLTTTKLPLHVALSMVAVVSNAVVDLQASAPALHQTFIDTCKPLVLEFYNTQVVLAKSAPSQDALALFGQAFVHPFVSLQDLQQTVPHLEKANLRSPEVSFGHITYELFANLAGDMNLLSVLTSSKLLAQLLSSLKASKEVTRAGASETARVIFAQHFFVKSEADEAESLKILSEIFKALKTASNIDHKLVYAQVIAALPTSEKVSAQVLAELVTYAAKDQNETTLAAFLRPLFKHFFAFADDKVSTAVLAGLADKKLNLRKAWATELAQAVVIPGSLAFLIKAYPTLVAALSECSSAPLPAVASRAISAAYATLAISAIPELAQLATDANVFGLALADGEKPSVLTNPRVYVKLTFTEDQYWFVEALKAAAPRVSKETAPAFTKALLYASMSNNIALSVKRTAITLIREAYIANQALIGNGITEGIKSLLLGEFANVSEDELKFEMFGISPVLNSLTLCHSEGINCLIIAHHQAVKLKNGWVGLCQRAGFDPGDVVKENKTAIVGSLGEILLRTTRTEQQSNMHHSALAALSTVAFIGSDEVSPLILDLLHDDLRASNFESITPEDIRVWQGKEGEMVVNVLDTNEKKKKVEDKNSKDYETKKWEESVRNEIAKKAVTKPKKLTRDEQALVGDQLAKESVIRAAVQAKCNSLLRGVGVINSLAEEAGTVDNGYATWFPLVVNMLLPVIQGPTSSALVGDLAVRAFLNLSNVISARLGAVRYFLGSATLRLLEVSNLPENLQEEDLLDLVSRVMFRVKILSDQKPLDSLSLIYILPLLIKVLENGQIAAVKSSTKAAVTSEFADEDREEEQLMLSLEILSTHSELFEDSNVPRKEILAILLSLMKLPAKAKLAKECFLSMCQHISVDTTPEDIQMLLRATVAPESFVRNAVLEVLDAEFDLAAEMGYASEIWIAVHDNEPHNALLASTIWQENSFSVDAESPAKLMAFLGNADGGLRLSVAKAVSTAISYLTDSDSAVFATSLDALLALYTLKAQPPAPILDAYGVVIKASTEQRDTWEERSGVALSLKLLAGLFSETSVTKFFGFLIEQKALGDKESIVRQELQDAGVEVINATGASTIESLIPIFEACLAAKDEGSRIQDHIRESVIILYGALARHLDASDPRLIQIVDRLVKTLDTPSEDVQFAVSECLAPLVKMFEPKLPAYFDKLFEKLFSGKSIAVRRGGAYGIAGLVKGAGIKALANNDIIRNLIDAAEDKKDPKRREGVAFAFECLSQCLGKFFEPYVIEILPVILKSLGDTAPEVREATDYATRSIMKHTTGFGVKQLIPLAIENLDQVAWRSKRGSVELLGSMAYLDPAQLSSSLATIVPEIVSVLNDSHKEVRKAADQSLKRFGEVIRNPEIQKLVPTLIKAIGDPTKYTEAALDDLIKTQFVHYIDGPSLALIIHVIHRAMVERSANTKRKACQIVGNMAILVDTKDLLPYLPQLVSELEISMVDPVSATRATAARALGSLVEKLGEEQFPDLIPRLFFTLEDESKAGDRLGSAQALAEVISGLGVGKLDELLPKILTGATSVRSYVRGGYMPLLLFLPVCFGNQFAPYLSRIIQPILNGLADIDEAIRDTALRAGRLIVRNYSTKAVDLLLPELEAGMADSSYRIRLSSVELTGELLYQVTGISGKTELSEEQSEASGTLNQTLIDVLGQDRRDRILALLYVCRTDTAISVRNATVDIWKSLVSNLPRTIKEILPTLTQIIVRKLASSDEVQRAIASNTLTDLGERAGRTAFEQLLPTLEESLITADSDSKQGICIAAGSLLESANIDTIVEYKSTFINIIRGTLVDSAPGVREAAALAFDKLQDSIGNEAVDEVLPYLLSMLESDDSENALSALEEIMATKSNIIFPILIPTLLAPPIDAFRARALGSLAEVAGASLYRRLSTIINAFVETLVNATADSETTEQIKISFDKVLLSVTEDEGCHPLLQQLLSLIKNDDSRKRAVICERLGPFFAHTTLDYSIYTQDMLTQLVMLLDDKDEEVVRHNWQALYELVKRQSKESMEKLVKPTRIALHMTGVRGTDLSGFALPKGPNCILPIFLHGLMYGTSEQRELSALGMADIVEKTPAANLKPFVTVMTGPLIRTIGERFSSDVKAAILYALNMLFAKIPQFLRPFIPQLQRTFVKSLSDPTNETLRTRAAKALGTLIEHQPRVDPLVTELVSVAKAAADAGVKTAILKALLEVVSKAGENMSEASKNGIMSLVEEEITSASDKLATAYARLVGSLARILTSEEAVRVIQVRILDAKLDAGSGKFAVLTLNAFLKDAPRHIFENNLAVEVSEFMINASNTASPYICDNAIVAMGKFLLLKNQLAAPAQFVLPRIANSKIEDPTAPFEIPVEAVSDVVRQLCVTMLEPASNSVDSRRLSLVCIRTIARFQYDEAIQPFFDALGPSVFACVRDPVVPIKLAAEKAFLALFNLVEDEQATAFNEWFAKVSAVGTTVETVVGAVVQLRSIGDYNKRVAIRLAGVERERIASGGDEETMYSDRFEDEGEIWAVGGVDLSN
ncbi:hypothetical protein BABINDRAFT_180589 [Babjeviella inositovora NRRL Y-12698]|uniref:TOG domain-containing protein n=1 Tax=Babjeviella inositovora NRRL Y-12698 TaxID=984486 RepID=A0A1E3QPA6_9ASCO|nr:uncharacterized protein BABINDRAFT_180589 [Babjeviella inositovora NRRL Y-12698]ODQ79468.1 hypothetical protein BABINDRAFT_180589 [Babjeviella inositovora NRRL Y-12698]